MVSSLKGEVWPKNGMVVDDRCKILGLIKQDE